MLKMYSRSDITAAIGASERELATWKTDIASLPAHQQHMRYLMFKEALADIWDGIGVNYHAPDFADQLDALITTTATKESA